ncbi:hypothetical protein ABT008_25260 [Micromonospora sp. NPDC002389]|uniref:hypothetical protein n=1 Tax=Micromonospora sp. NPDC002389 TaxID=3154272 RepID=UPI00331EDDAD
MVPACLNAGWRPGLTGVTDEHGTTWGFHGGKGRSGLWVTENTRAADGDWVVLRISDPALPSGTPGPVGHPCNDFGVAYTSPWWWRP